jgi:Xaa-Pro aminopeptidase
MQKAKIDLLYVASPDNMLYLSGYQALWYQAQVLEHWVPISGIAIRADADDCMLFESDAEINLCKYSTVGCDLRTLDRHDMTLLDFAVDELKAAGWTKGTLGLEMLAYRPPRAVSEELQAKLERAGIKKTVDATAIVNGVRHIKSPQEMAFTRTAARISEIGMRAAQAAIRPGVTELEVWGEVMAATAKAGGENPSITLPVDAGPKSAIPHSMSSRRVMCAGDIVNVDVCAVYNRYHSDCARSFSIGEPHPDVADTIAKSARSFEVMRKAAKPGVSVQRVCDALKAYYKEVGLWGEQWWTGGYDLGCAMPPDWVGPFSYDVDVNNGKKAFEDGVVVNYESDFYLPRGAGMSLLIETFLFDGDRVDIAHPAVPPDLIVIE